MRDAPHQETHDWVAPASTNNNQVSISIACRIREYSCNSANRHLGRDELGIDALLIQILNNPFECRTNGIIVRVSHGSHGYRASYTHRHLIHMNNQQSSTATLRNAFSQRQRALRERRPVTSPKDGLEHAHLRGCTHTTDGCTAGLTSSDRKSTRL